MRIGRTNGVADNAGGLPVRKWIDEMEHAEREVDDRWPLSLLAERVRRQRERSQREQEASEPPELRTPPGRRRG